MVTFQVLMKEKSDDQCLDYYDRVRYKDDGLKKIIGEGIGYIGYSFKKNRVEKDKNENRCKYQALEGFLEEI